MRQDRLDIRAARQAVDEADNDAGAFLENCQKPISSPLGDSGTLGAANFILLK